MGKCTNSTKETITVYGGKHPNQPAPYSESRFVLKPGASTPDGWDCDGFFVPKDRTLHQRIGSNPRGPLAVKFIGAQGDFVVTQNDDQYRTDKPDFWTYSPEDSDCANAVLIEDAPIIGDIPNPRKVCWPIPDIAQSQVEQDAFPIS
jgi:hypothetical protein